MNMAKRIGLFVGVNLLIVPNDHNRNQFIWRPALSFPPLLSMALYILSRGEPSRGQMPFLPSVASLTRPCLRPDTWARVRGEQQAQLVRIEPGALA